MITLPTRKEIYDSIIASFEAEYNTTISSFGKVFIRALATTQAAKLWLIYKAIGNSQKNIFPDTADSEAYGGTLERFGRIKLGRNPFGATAGQYNATVTGTTGAIIPANTLYKSDDTSTSPGMIFTVDNDFTFTGSNTLTIRALTAGLEAKLNTSDTLTVTGPLASFDAKITILSEAVQPQAAEDLEVYRRFVLEAYRLEPEGGSGADYRLWSSEAQGVLQTYPYKTAGSDNGVDLYIEAIGIDSSDGKGTPTPTILAAVETAIETATADRPARKPLTVVVNYQPITVKEIDINISLFSGATSAIQASIFAAMKEELSKVRPFVGSIDILADRNDRFDINKIVSVIIAANPGSVFGTVTLKVDGVTVNSFTFQNGDIPNLNSITYV